MKFIIFAFLCLSLSFEVKSSNELTLYVVPSPLGMDWTSPSTLAWSALKNRLSFRPRFMGHVFVELKCQDTHEATGMVGKNFDYLNQLLIQQRGLGILFHSFDGRLEEKEEVLSELEEYFETGYVNFTRFLLNDHQCQRAKKYLTEYREHNVGRYYGLANRPRHAEGAGCSAFGVSFPEVLGILDQEMKESWSHSVNVPLDLSGPPVTDEGVGLLKVMFNADSWAKAQDQHRKLFFWDPDKMHRWINKRVSKPQVGETVLLIKKSQGLILDKSHYPASEAPIWQQSLN